MEAGHVLFHVFPAFIRSSEFLQTACTNQRESERERDWWSRTGEKTKLLYRERERVVKWYSIKNEFFIRMLQWSTAIAFYRGIVSKILTLPLYITREESTKMKQSWDHVGTNSIKKVSWLRILVNNLFLSVNIPPAEDRKAVEFMYFLDSFALSVHKINPIY